MSEDAKSLQEAQQKINELLDAARTGAIIPVRLPNQIEEIANLITKADTEHEEAIREAKVKVGPADMETYMEEEAHFVGHAVHELNTPLTSIRGYSDMLGSMGELNDMQKQFLDVVKNNSRWMQNLLSDFRYLNKIRKGTLKPQPKMDMYKNLAMKLEKEMGKEAEELERSIEFDIPSGLPLLNVDSEMLSIALTKLVENAIHYSLKGEGMIKISGAGEDGYLVISIEDNGIGMSEEELGKLGEVYFRGERDEVREFKGSGLGIPIAYGMIDLIDGEITVKSKLDEGTKFTVRIKGMS
jgi:two-component system, OmpR family, phosphate regulon sensor histidine kinase PhoR